MDKSGKSIEFYLTILIAAVIVVAVIASILTGNSVRTLGVGTPEKTVQEYLQSLTDERNDLAAKRLSKNSSCTVEDIDRSYSRPSTQITLIESETTADSAIVQVLINHDNDIFMDSGTSEEQTTFRLKKESGQWKITGIPWPLYQCGAINK